MLSLTTAKLRMMAYWPCALLTHRKILLRRERMAKPPTPVSRKTDWYSEIMVAYVVLGDRSKKRVVEMTTTPPGIAVYRWSSPVFAHSHPVEGARSFQRHHHQERFCAIY